MLMICMRCIREVVWMLNEVVEKILIGGRKGLRGWILMIIYLEI